MPPRPSPTHFLCIALCSPQLGCTMSSFRADVTSNYNVPEQAVRPLGTLHLTLGVMNLKEEDVVRAVEFLRGLRLGEFLEQARKATHGQSEDGQKKEAKLKITLRGLHTMQSPSKTSVLYAAPDDPTSLLGRFCESLRDRFTDAGLMVQDTRPLLLHATVVNTIYVKGRGKTKQRLMIDASDIVARYEDYVWMDGVEVERVKICRMGAKKIEGTDGDEAYEVEGEVGF